MVNEWGKRVDLSWLNQVPEPLRSILVGATGDFLGGIGAEVAGRLLDAAGYRVRKRLEPEPRRAALDRAMSRALYEVVRGLADGPDEMVHYLGILGEWLQREAVAGEMAQLVDPQAGGEIDVELLRRELSALGYDPELLGHGITFARMVAGFATAFYDAAAAEPELEGPIQIGLLRGIAEQLTRAWRKRWKTGRRHRKCAAARRA